VSAAIHEEGKNICSGYSRNSIVTYQGKVNENIIKLSHVYAFQMGWIRLNTKYA
jgi:ATP-dependent Clp protease adapter protein ClpS